MSITQYGFNWSWVAAPNETKRESNVVLQGSGTIYNFSQPARGAISSADLSSFAKSVGQNMQRVRSDWRTYTRPILNSLPAGNTDTRWSTDLGKGLPDKIDCFKYGVQGTTLFVFNDAASTNADGRYWHGTDFRPKTIAEAFEDLYGEIASIETSLQVDTSVDLDPLWAAIGEAYRDTDRATTVGSLDTRTSTIETYIAQLNSDIYEPETFTYELGSPLPYSIAKMLDEVLKLHNGPGWGGDPTVITHSGVSAGAHTHPFTEVTPAPAAADTSDRAQPYVNLENEVKHLRWEIQRTRGSSNWYSDVSYPFGGTASLNGHIGQIGSGTASVTNPHGINYIDLGVNTYLDAIVSFTGMSSYADASPTYTSTNYITQGTSLEEAISDLDDSLLGSLASTVIRKDYGPYDRSATDEETRELTPIVINHNMGRKPVLHVLDVSPEEYYSGEYLSPEVDSNITYLDNDTVEIWTNAAVVEIIAFF